jgi:hypothetical protein
MYACMRADISMTKFEMVDVNFGPDAEHDIEHFIEQQLAWLEEAHRDLHTNKIPRWRKIYLGTPAEASRNFPFPNAANTVVQVVGETVDTMVARVMGLLYATHPLWKFSNFSKEKDMATRKLREERRQQLESFMDIVGMEPDELNLQPVEALWWTDATKLGTGFVKVGLEQVMEAVVVGYQEAKTKGKDVTIYDGPRVTNLRHEDVYADPSVDSLDKAAMVAVRHKLYRTDLEDRAFREIYDKKVVNDIMGSPDRSTQRPSEREELNDQGISAIQKPEVTAEWDVYECYFPWWHNGRKFRLVYSYHKKTKKVLRKVFNFLPKNELPVKRTRLGHRTNGLYGHGYSELLETYQEELSTTHNQRLDNATVANIRALRVSPRARALDANMELYPSGLLIGEKDEIEAIAVGDVYPSTFKNEEMTLQLVARRAGITPAVSGSGSGGMMKRPAIYSAQGTMAVMQENNSVVGFATSEFRHAHVSLGSLLTAMYGRFGTGDRDKMFGLNAQSLQEALQEFDENRLRIPVRASTGSLNQEVDKQTGVIMAGLMQRHYTAVSQMMQAINNPMIDPKTKAWMVSVVQASELLHKRVVKDFGYEQPDIYVPEAEVGEPAGGQANAGGEMAPGGVPMGGGGGAPVGGTGPVLPGGSMAGPIGGLVPNIRQ